WFTVFDRGVFALATDAGRCLADLILARVTAGTAAEGVCLHALATAADVTLAVALRPLLAVDGGVFALVTDARRGLAFLIRAVAADSAAAAVRDLVAALALDILAGLRRAARVAGLALAGAADLALVV